MYEMECYDSWEYVHFFFLFKFVLEKGNFV